MFIHNVLLPLALSTVLSFATPTPTLSQRQDLLTIDLGYGIYRASYYNVLILIWLLSSPQLLC